MAPIQGLRGVCFEDPGLRPGLTEVAALRLEAATVATRRGFFLGTTPFRGLKPTATGNRREATADERCQLRGERDVSGDGNQRWIMGERVAEAGDGKPAEAG